MTHDMFLEETPGRVAQENLLFGPGNPSEMACAPFLQPKEQGAVRAAVKELWPSSAPNLRPGGCARSNQDLDF